MFLFNFAELFLINVETMLVCWKCPLRHLLSVGFKGFEHQFAQVNISFGKFGCEAIKESQYIVDDQYLTIAMNACTNSNGWNGQTLCDHFRNRGGDGFEEHREGPRLFKL